MEKYARASARHQAVGVAWRLLSPHTPSHAPIRRERERERESSALLAALFDQLTGASSAEHGSQRERSANPNSYLQRDSTHTASRARLTRNPGPRPG